METVLRILGVISALAFLSIIIALPVMLLWNWLVPDILGYKSINFGQALGISLLCSLLFKDSSNNKD